MASTINFTREQEFTRFEFPSTSVRNEGRYAITKFTNELAKVFPDVITKSMINNRVKCVELKSVPGNEHWVSNKVFHLVNAQNVESTQTVEMVAPIELCGRSDEPEAPYEPSPLRGLDFSELGRVDLTSLIPHFNSPLPFDSISGLNTPVSAQQASSSSSSSAAKTDEAAKRLSFGNGQ
ncbi:MAG: hypothetical protein JSS32_09795 [Verrucomicrobia bacterium]|nr:hypothetical protein [Verrucomicrobiota bacterium]